MIENISRPNDLGNYVFDALPMSFGRHVRPSAEVLNSFFEVLFYASLDTEEGDLIKVTTTLFNPIAVQPNKLKSDRWRFVKFDNKIAFNIANLVKLSKAADPWSSTLAVYFDLQGNLWIHGLIDQALHVQSFLNYESEDKPTQPGLFQASIIDIGSISVLRDYKLIASLNKDILVTKYIDVLKSGIIYSLLREDAKLIRDQALQNLTNRFLGTNLEDWEEFFDNIWQNTISRLLIQIKNYHHGGALLISDRETNLEIKYAISYKRIGSSIKNLVQQNLKEENLLSQINNSDLSLDMELFINYQNCLRAKDNAKNDLKASIRFVSSHSCVDGLILLDGQLNTKGFGVIVRGLSPPDSIYVSSSTTGKPYIEKNPKHFGTRHQSMFAYCFNNPGSIGFIVSQDGDIRATTRVGDKLIVWENIKTQQFIRTTPLKDAYIKAKAKSMENI
ncbi:putative sensor domain DACNV-containing protein [Pedobacter sp. 22226]|uniref:putative sensor domain DACNV-containing protein n=1 Tax=Pedobacter sp. 22226 TaxID=3453894 RepID=UPI003F8770F5